MKNILKSFLSILLAFMMVFTFGITSLAADSKPNMVDAAGMLEAGEVEELETLLDDISNKNNMDVVAVIVSDLEGKTAQEYADDYYDYNGYGYGESRDGILLLIDMGSRKWHISVCGEGITAFTDSGLEFIADKFVDKLSDGKLDKAIKIYAKWCDKFIEQANEGMPYDSGNMPKEIPGFKWVLYCLVIGYGISFFIGGRKKSKMKSIVEQKTATDYTRPGSVTYLGNSDRYIRTSTTSRIIETESSSSSSGSSTHSSSSGTSHGGTGGSF